MKKILVIGAGLSASYLIKYLLDQSQQQQWIITVADSDKLLAEHKVNSHPNGNAIELNVTNEIELSTVISQNDLIISMLPASMHIIVAKDCLKHKKHLITASYISAEMQNLHADALSAGILFLNECGLDPGIDHLSAMKMIDGIKNNVVYYNDPAAKTGAKKISVIQLMKASEQKGIVLRFQDTSNKLSLEN